MNSAAHVDNDINNWKSMGMSKAETVVLIAEDCIGWPYVYGERGTYDTPAKRRSRADAQVCLNRTFTKRIPLPARDGPQGNSFIAYLNCIRTYLPRQPAPRERRQRRSAKFDRLHLRVGSRTYPR